MTGYDVLRDDAVIASVSGTTLTYADATVAASTTYSYQVVAKDLAGNHSGPSVASSVTTPAPSDTEAPSVPTGVSAVAASSSLVDVSWTASTDNVGVTGYDVLRDDAVIASVSGTTLTYADATVAASTTYSYQVVAKDLAGNQSGPSIASSVTTPAPSDTEAPSVPTGVSAVAASSSLVNVSWTASTDNVGVTGYDVLRDDAVIASVSGTTLTYADATVAASTTYSYRWWPRTSPATSPLRASRPVVTTPAPSGPTTLSFVAAADSYTDGDGRRGQLRDRHQRLRRHVARPARLPPVRRQRHHRHGPERRRPGVGDRQRIERAADRDDVERLDRDRADLEQPARAGDRDR